MGCRTDDPVRDHDSYQLATMDRRPVVGTCACCGYEIRGDDDIYEEDDAYLFENGDMCCSECLRDYANEHFRI